MAEVLDLTLSDCEDDGESEDDASASSPANAFPGSDAAASVKHEIQTRSTSLRPQFNNSEDAPQVTIVNGIGFWKSWTRSFKTTLLKLLDLIDNSVDGATIEEIPGFTGRVHIYPDVYEQSATTRKGKKLTSTTGLCIRNNSPHKIVPLAEALVVHNTTKIDAGEIGENGVGLKQACAALCDLSFVLVKNGSNANIELGIVAKSLQREEGPYLPAFQFSNEKGEGQTPLREQMSYLFSKPKHNDVAICIAQWGADIAGGEPSLAAGIDGLCTRFDDICHEFYNNDYVFEVILNNIRHEQSEGLAKRAMYAQQKITVNNLIKDLQREIPCMYLHIPDSFEFLVGKKRLIFDYWQERLVEFSTFTVPVGATIPWKQNFEDSAEHRDAYDLRLFLGFDRYRIVESDFDANTGEKKETKNASLYFYSRMSGRLIKSEPDARHMLGLSTGTSLYAAALTIIIDDVDGNLPLHPTKQDLAFGNENRGAVHEENLLAWVGAVTKFYYHYQLKKFSNKKKALSAHVSQYYDKENPIELKAYNKSDFTTFELPFEQYRSSIRVDSKLAKENVGSDTFFRLLPGPVAGAPKGKKRSRSSTQRRQSRKKPDQQPAACDAETKEPISHQEDSDSERGVIKRSSKKPTKYREESDLDSEIEVSKMQRSRKNPNVYREESDPDSEIELSKLPGKESTSYQEESDSDQDSEIETSVKMEEAAINNASTDSGCINLCESSDEEDENAVRDDQLPNSDAHVSKLSQAGDTSDDESQTNNARTALKAVSSNSDTTKERKMHELELTMANSRIKCLQNENKALRESKADASQSDISQKKKFHELEEELNQLRVESGSKIRALTKELNQKEKVISVLKRRLGAK